MNARWLRGLLCWVLQVQAAEAATRSAGLSAALEECQDMVDCLQAFSHDQARFACSSAPQYDPHPPMSFAYLL